LIIPLDDKTRIRGTEKAWQLERKHRRNGVDDWKAFSYYTKFADAVGAACQRELRTTPAHGVTEAIAACSRVTQKYAKIFDEVGRHQKEAA
jgi:hypothetical protein